MPTSAERYRERRAEGSCPSCGRCPGPERVYCRKCVRNVIRHARRVRASGRCLCGAEPVPGRSMCPACALRHRLRAAERARALAALGRCYCGRKPKPGRRCCQRCITRAVELKARRRAKGRG